MVLSEVAPDRRKPLARYGATWGRARPAGLLLSSPVRGSLFVTSGVNFTENQRFEIARSCGV